MSSGVAVGTAIVGEMIMVDRCRAKRAKREEEWRKADVRKRDADARKRDIEMHEGKVDRLAAKMVLKHHQWDVVHAVISLTQSSIE